MNIRAVLSACTLALCFGAQIEPIPAIAKQNETVADSIISSVPGGLYLYPLPQGVQKVLWQNKPVLIFEDVAYIGLSLKAKPGQHELQVLFEDGSSLNHKFTVIDKTYPEQRLTIKNKKMVNPDPENLSRIAEEGKQMRARYQSFNPPVGGVRPFIQPVDGITSSPFGRKRILNDQPRNPHSGLDIAAKTGTPILAPAPATVSLTGDFYFNGNTVFLDHGYGLISMVCHLSEISVAPGDIVQRNQLVGLVGATGRVTGPHLHWSVSLNGVRIDPVMVMHVLGDSNSQDDPTNRATEQHPKASTAP